jgi:hypothetical protein
MIGDRLITKVILLIIRVKFIYYSKLIFINRILKTYSKQGNTTINANKIGNNTIQQKDIN